MTEIHTGKTAVESHERAFEYIKGINSSYISRLLVYSNCFFHIDLPTQEINNPTIIPETNPAINPDIEFSNIVVQFIQINYIVLEM